MKRMTRMQVVVNARNSNTTELDRCIQSLLRQIPSLEFFACPASVFEVLSEKYGQRITKFASFSAHTNTLITRPEIIYAKNSLKRLNHEAGSATVTRVLIGGEENYFAASLWQEGFLHDERISADTAIEADLDFDRMLLSHESPTARRWVQGETVGIARQGTVTNNFSYWSASTNTRLRLQRVLTNVRKRLGTYKRRNLLRKQRRMNQRTARS